MLARRSLLTLLAADEGNWCRGGSYTTSPAPSTAVYRTPQIHMRGQLATLAAAVVFVRLWRAMDTMMCSVGDVPACIYLESIFWGCCAVACWSSKFQSIFWGCFVLPCVLSRVGLAKTPLLKRYPVDYSGASRTKLAVDYRLKKLLWVDFTTLNTPQGVFSR